MRGGCGSVESTFLRSCKRGSKPPDAVKKNGAYIAGKKRKGLMPRTRSKGRSRRPRAASRTRRPRARSGSRRGRCVRQTSARYTTRGSPPFPANQCCGETKRGNDGAMYRSIPNIRGICTWRKAASNGSRVRSRARQRSRRARRSRTRARFGTRKYDHENDVDVSKIARAEQERYAAQGRLDEIRRRAVRARQEASEREIIARYSSSSR